MSINTYDSFKTKRDAPYQRITGTKLWPTTGAGTTGRLRSNWLTTPFAGVAPSTAVVPTNALAGAMNGPSGILNSSGVQRLLRVRFAANSPFTESAEGTLFLVDRVSHQGGLSGTVATAQTTNLPTAALTRYTTGVDLWLALEVFTVIGGTATTVTTSYTNQAGTAGQISVASVFGGTGAREAGLVQPLPLASGDYGVRSVESVTLAASTLTAGNFGVVLMKPLLMLPFVRGLGDESEWDAVIHLGGNAPEILSSACLQWLLVTPQTAGVATTISYELMIAED